MSPKSTHYFVNIIYFESQYGERVSEGKRVSVCWFIPQNVAIDGAGQTETRSLICVARVGEEPKHSDSLAAFFWVLAVRTQTSAVWDARVVGGGFTCCITMQDLFKIIYLRDGDSSHPLSHCLNDHTS